MIAVQKENIRRGAGCVLIAATSYSIMSVFVKLAKEASDAQLVFVRNFVCLLLLMPWILFPQPKSLATKKIGLQFLRGLAGLLNIYCFFYSLRYILLVDAMLLNSTMPLFIPFIVWVCFKTKISLKLIPGLVIGFLGVLFILRPGIGIFQPAALLALASGLLMGISMTGIRELGKHEPIYRILFYYFAICTFLSSIPLIGSWENNNRMVWALMIGIGVCAFITQYFLTQGFQYASPRKVSSLIYFAVILSGLFDWILWNNVPDIFSYVGAILVIFGAIYCIRLEL